MSIGANAAVLPLGNFKKDATVRPSHGRPRGHRPSVRPSENVRVTTLVWPRLALRLDPVGHPI
jgi:hypothetical protein